jgi:hypothetical protein
MAITGNDVAATLNALAIEYEARARVLESGEETSNAAATVQATMPPIKS